jgi:hypothetical protein
VKCYIWSIALYGAETWALRKINHKYLKRFEMWCWKRKQQISWTDHVRNEDAVQRVEKERNALQTVKRRKDNWIGHILRKNCLLRHVTEGKIERRIEVVERRGRSYELLDVLKEERG